MGAADAAAEVVRLSLLRATVRRLACLELVRMIVEAQHTGLQPRLLLLELEDAISR